MDGGHQRFRYELPAELSEPTGFVRSGGPRVSAVRLS
jgi:hypothetical protein